MAKIINFPSKSDKNVDDFLDEIKEFFNEEGADSVVVLAKTKGNCVLTSYFNCDMSIRHELHSHLYLDIIDNFIKINYLEE